MAKNERYWFKRRRYGWGWTPVTWQGWLCVAVFLAAALTAGFMILPAEPQDPTAGQLAFFFVVLALIIAAVIAISIAKGPAPRWRWGKKPSDDPSEDI